MPELPEVETVVRSLAPHLPGRRIISAKFTSRFVTPGDRSKLAARLAGRTIESVSRRGKFIVIALDAGSLAIHLGMTGKWVRRATGQAEPYSRARLLLEDGSVLHYRDPRLFGRIEPAPADALERLPGVMRLGRDPLLDGLQGPDLEALFRRSRTPLKVALMDQHRLAGQAPRGGRLRRARDRVFSNPRRARKHGRRGVGRNRRHADPAV